MTKIRRDDPEQSKLFIQKAREMGADAPAEAADALMGRLAEKAPRPRPVTKGKFEIARAKPSGKPRVP